MLALFGFPIYLFYLHIVMFGPHCDVEIHAKLAGPGSYKFEIRENFCGAFISRWNTASVHASDGKKSALLFEYDPIYFVGLDGHLPTLTIVGPNQIRISVWRLDHIRVRLDKWQDLTIDYNIGQSHDSDPVDEKSAPPNKN